MVQGRQNDIVGSSQLLPEGRVKKKLHFAAKTRVAPVNFGCRASVTRKATPREQHLYHLIRLCLAIFIALVRLARCYKMKL